MSLVRRVLDLLDLEGLVRLQELRGLSGKASNDDRRTGLSRSYRGDLQAMASDLRREDLQRILARPFLLAGARYLSPGLQGFTRDELLRMALRLFVRREAPREFTRVEDDAFVIDPHENDDEDDQNAPGSSVTGIENGERISEENTAADEGPEAMFALEGSAWSRPRGIPRILGKLGMDSPERLRSARFQEMMRKLEALGIEAQLSDGNSVTSADESPGIDEKLRLRKRAGPVGTVLSIVPERASPSGVAQVSINPPSPIEILFRPAAHSLGPNAIVRCTLTGGLPGLQVEQGPTGTAAVTHATYESLLNGAAGESLPKLREGTFILQFTRAPEMAEEIRPSLAVALALLAAATGRVPVPGIVVIGDVGEGGEVLPSASLADLVRQAIAQGSRSVVVPAASASALSEIELGDDVEILPVATITDAAAFALKLDLRSPSANALGPS